MAKSLRAVGYCRTSGEGQRDNTSIPRQKDDIEAFCKREGWEFVKPHYVDECKTGSRIAGREDFQEMMRAAARDCFDVIVVANPKRFGRDGLDILNSLRTLSREFGVHVVDTTGVLDTRDRRRTLSNYVQAGVAEDERLTIMDRTINGKIRRAQYENIPTNGRYPYGRTFDRQSKQWGVNREIQDMIRQIADRYIAGESLNDLAEEFGVSYPQLWKHLRHDCGDTWTVTYRVPEIDIESTTVTHQIPRLLPEKMIRAVQKRMEANRTFLHGKSKNEYLLQGRIFCGNCGFLMTGAVRPSGVRLYRHNMRSNACPVTPRPSVRADMVERAVVRDLMYMFSNYDAIREAVLAAVPESKKLEQQRDRLRSRLEANEKGVQRLVDMIDSGSLKPADAKRKLDERNKEREDLKTQLESLEEQLIEMPETLPSDAALLHIYCDPQFDEQRRQEAKRLLKSAFELPLADGSPAGVYVTPTGGSQHGPKQFSYEIRGRLIGTRTGATQSRSSDRSRSAPR